MNAPPKNPTTANRLRRDCVRRGHRHRSLSKLALFRCAFLFDFPSQRPSANLTDGVIYARVSACTKSARNDECAAFSEPARNRVEITDDVGVVMDARPRRGTWRDRRGKAFCSFDGAVSESDPPSVIPRVHAPIRRRFIYGDDHDDRAACVRDVVKTGSTAFDFTACHGRGAPSPRECFPRDYLIFFFTLVHLTFTSLGRRSGPRKLFTRFIPALVYTNSSAPAGNGSEWTLRRRDVRLRSFLGVINSNADVDADEMIKINK